MSVENYRKTGRGGAGNFYSQQVPARRTEEDIEAQGLSSSSPSYPDVDLGRRSPEHAHSGRGGAGNWYTPESVADMNRADAPAAAGAAASHRKQRLSGNFGRGGAGNYSRELANRQKAEEERKLRELEEEASERSLRDVELGLKMPEKAHLGGREE